MIVKALNLYRIIHKNGTTEDINAVSLSVALENMTTSEETSPVICADMISSNTRTVILEDTNDEENNNEEENEDTEPDTEIGGEVDIEGNV